MKRRSLGIAAGACVLLAACGYRLLPLTTAAEEPLVVGTANSLTTSTPPEVRQRVLGAVQQHLPEPAHLRPRGDRAPARRGRIVRVHRALDHLPVQGARRPHVLQRASGHRRGREALVRPRPGDPGPPRAGAAVREPPFRGGERSLRDLPPRDGGRHLALQDRHTRRIDRRSGRVPRDGLRTRRTFPGSGPYLLTSYEKGVRVGLVPNPAYKGPSPRRASRSRSATTRPPRRWRRPGTRGRSTSPTPGSPPRRSPPSRTAGTRTRASPSGRARWAATSS